MENVFMQMHEHWLLIAQEDLDSSKHLFSASLITTLFHIQQCAEKSLKSYLVLKTGTALKTHDLVRLVDICMELDERFETLRLLAAVLTPYQTAGRYPDSSFAKPSREKIQKLIEQSEYIFNFVAHQIENEITKYTNLTIL
jgi:HEPN domain-containing protein